MSGCLIVTGGSRGIGAAIARAAAREGWRVCLTYQNRADAAEEVVAAIEAEGGQALAVRADAADTDAGPLFDRTEAAFGPVRGLVCNAAITGGFARATTVKAETVRRVFEVNVFGLMAVCAEAVRRMSTATGGVGGSIVAISSTATKAGSPGEWVHYAASKGAVDVFVGGLAREVAAEGVRVNAVAPGTTLTDLHAEAGEPNRPERIAATVPMGRSATPEEVAEAALWLLSDKAAYVTGAILPVAGGR
ncbi:SDR family oxidoreductase [Inquilinus sp. CAU 1745]|uniref:SDR family oxidoreductase n=1 Tax=Inquilinus sp. CAU 1745 TaxID=3140369 RepID=UPI00325B14EF